MNTITITDEAKLSTSEMMKIHKEKFKTYCHWNDDELDKFFPIPKSPTTRLFLKQADPNLCDKSYNNLKKEKHEFMTLREYILFFEEYHKERGEYPDENGWTIFSDPKLPAGDVARGLWNADDGESLFGWDGADCCRPCIGARLAVSLNPCTPLSLETSDVKEKCRAFIESLEKLYKSL